MGEPDAGLEEYISQTQPKKTTCYREAVSVPVQKTGQNKHYNGWQHYYHLILLKYMFNKQIYIENYTYNVVFYEVK